MRNFTLRKGFLGSKCGTRSSFKGFVMLVVMMLMSRECKLNCVKLQ